MKSSRFHIDKPLALIIAALVVGGALVFASAAFGLLARGQGNMTSVVFSHVVLGIGLGLIALVIACSLDYKIWRRYALYFFGFSLLLTALVFVPGIGFSHGGGTRWLDLFGFSLQPSEILKIASVIMAATYFAGLKGKVDSLVEGLGGFFAILALPVIILILQPDLGTLSVICASVLAIYVTAGARLRDIAIIICIAVIGLGALAIMRPYVLDRITTFLNPAQDQHAQSYQIKQSLIAIGSGQLLGRGFGQSVQKFTYLPEPMGDSIFAVAAEELGFAGASVIILAFLAFALRGYLVATRATDYFGGLLAVGLSTYLAIEAFVNIAAMLGVAPLTGIPLTFISQGGSAMLASLAAAGILLSVSRHTSRK